MGYYWCADNEGASWCADTEGAFNTQDSEVTIFNTNKIVRLLFLIQTR